MAKRIKITSKRSPGIISTSKVGRSVDKAWAMEAIGAKVSDIKNNERPAGPPALFGLRQQIYERLRSTGGRRSLEGADKRRKIPLLEGDWERLQQVAQASRTEAADPTPAQVASVLLHNALDRIEPSMKTRHAARARKR